MPLSVLLSSLALCGCDSQADPAVFRDSQQAYTDGMQAVATGQHESAVELLTIAIDGGGLLPDDYGLAVLERATCRARLGQFESAHADVQLAAQGAPPALVHRARSFVLAREGKKRESDAEWQRARRLNRTLRRIED